jgi:hypothetical protein
LIHSWDLGHSTLKLLPRCAKLFDTARNEIQEIDQPEVRREVIAEKLLQRRQGRTGSEKFGGKAVPPMSPAT